jgi:sigma-B regulation protein RsbU (phosphoserine phosphatase)
MPEYAKLKSRLLNLYLLNLGANFTGFLIVGALNLFTPTEYFIYRREFILSEGWPWIFFLYPIMIFLGLSVHYLIQHPVSSLLLQVCTRENVRAHRIDRARRRLLNLPYGIALSNVALWVGFTSLLFIAFFILKNLPAFEDLRLYNVSLITLLFGVFRGIIIGWIAALLSFFILEAYIRKGLIPIFFPKGKIAALSGAKKISIQRRIRLLYMAGTTVPMIIFVGTLVYAIGEYEGSQISAAVFGNDLLIYAVIWCVIFIAVALCLNFLVGRSIVQPIKEMLRVIKGVHRGDYIQRVQVVSNDELGVLGDGINQMSGGILELEGMRNSMNLAKEVQQALLPHTTPTVAGLDIAASSAYCTETGGDYYDFISDDENSNHTLSIIVGDVAGYGIPSALLMASVRAFIRQRMALPGRLGTIVSDVNRQLADDIEESLRFIALFMLQLDPENRILQWVRAGHNPAVFYDPVSDTFDELRGSGLVLGIDKKWQYDEYARSNLTQGQIILLGTDGFWEAQNSEGRMLGKKAIYPVIRETKDAGAKEILAACFDALESFQQNSDLEDDMTLIVVKITH